MADQPNQPEVKSGMTFAVEVVPGKTIDDVRKEAFAKFGHEIHIRAKIGPIEIAEDGKSLGCPIEAVDDQLVFGNFSLWPQHAGCFLLIGHFK